MACGEEGNGRLAPVDMLVAELVKALSPKDLAGNKVLISLGPTREYFDPARFWSNPSTGAMGACLSMAAWLRGAHVHVVQGPLGNGAWWFPPDVQVHDVTSAEEMAAACLDVWPDMDLGVMTAAVADYKPTPHADGATKFKKAECGSLDVCFTCNTDILSEMGARKKHGQRLVGFSAETNDLEANASAKLTRKNCDVIVANRIGVPGSGFASPTNEALGLAADGRKQTYPPLAKASLAWKLWDFILDTTR
jgi:phosphopantothenoylcysteine decarboxylase/phosphopantothenate--cysteine ligase